MLIDFTPSGVCAKRMLIQVDDGVVTDLKVAGGCSGNLQGIARLVTGLPVEEVIRRLDGIQCGNKPTSCPDQLASALKQALEQGMLA